MYPAPGRQLLPSLLKPSLGYVRVHPRLVRRLGLPIGCTLGDLDGSIWQGRTAGDIKLLAHEIVDTLNSGLSAEVAKIELFTDRPLISELDIAPRTRNRLLLGGLTEEGHLRPTSIGAMWQVPNLGAITLLDVFTAIDAAGPPRAGQPPESQGGATPSRAVRRAAEELAKKRWAGMVASTDPRLGDAVTILAPLARNAREAADLAAEASYTPAAAKQTASSIRDFTKRAEALRKLSLQTELEEIVRALTERDTATAALVARFGLNGSEPMTLERAGRVIGVTRERVRQLERRFEERLGKCGTVWTPALDRALKLIDKNLPATPSELEAALAEAGLSDGEFSIASLLAAADLFGKSLDLTKVGDVLATPGNWPPDSVIRSTSRRLVEHWGATTVPDVELALTELGFDIDPNLLALALESQEGFSWLDAEHSWFWIRGTRNRLLNQARKIMSVAGTIDLSDLRSGVGRHHRMNGFRPPREVLAALCVESGEYHRDGDRIAGDQHLPDWRTVLGPNERKLAQALFDFGPVMRREDLERVVVAERGLNRSSFYVYLTYSPILERFAPGVFGLRGAPVSAAEVEALVPPRVRHQVLQDDGWTQDGQIWAAFKISPAAESTGVLGTPSAIRSVTGGSFALFDDDDRMVGTLVVEQSMWGLSPFFRRWGVEAGDFVVITLNIGERRASVSVGSEELLLRYQAGE